MGAAASMKRGGAAYKMPSPSQEVKAAEKVADHDAAVAAAEHDGVKVADGIWDDMASFESHLSHGTVIAGLQFFAALFQESGIGAAIDLTVETKILQQVATFHLPMEKLVEAIETHLKPLGESPDPVVAASPATALASPPDFASKVDGLHAKLHSALHKNKHALHQLQGVDFNEVKKVLRILGTDGADSLGKLEAVIRCTKSLVKNTTLMADSAAAFWAKAQVVKNDMDDMSKLSITAFCTHLEAAFRAGKELSIVVKAEVADGEAEVEAVKALIESLEALYAKLKEANSEHAISVESQLALLRELPALTLEASTGASSVSSALEGLLEDMGVSVADAGKSALKDLFESVVGGSNHSDVQSAITEALMSALSKLIQSAVRATLAKVLALAVRVTGGTVSETIGFHFESFLSLQFTIVADLAKVAEIVKDWKVPPLPELDGAEEAK